MNPIAANLEKILKNLVKTSSPDLTDDFLIRISQGKFSRDENPESHFCVYFPAIDPIAGEVFIGHHRKAGLWLPNGGHIDEGELPEKALKREIGEEWGVPLSILNIPKTPNLITLTQITRPAMKIPCKTHYDLWYFIQTDKKRFHPDWDLLATEYHEIRWMSFAEARQFAKDKTVLLALEAISLHLQID